MEKDRTIQSKKKQKIDAIEPSDEHFSWFDHLKRDESYAALLSCRQEDLGSSHAIKRFFWKIPGTRLPVSLFAADAVHLETEEELSRSD